MALFFGGLLSVFLLSQIFWAWRIRDWAKLHISSSLLRRRLALAGIVVYVASAAYNFGWFGRSQTPTRLTVAQALLAAPFLWWFASSLIAFLLMIPFGIARGVARVTMHKDLASPSRRGFLERTATIVAAAPFVAGAYGLLYGRLNLEVTHRQIHLANLPRQFRGFRIAQLSDIHIGPFMPESEVRKYAEIANSLRADLLVLTGDFVTWDASTQHAAVAALSGLRAPFGVFGCLGNHDAWAGVEDSITELFRSVGVRILRHENVQIASDGERFNLIGVDFESRRRTGPRNDHLVRDFLDGAQGLILPHTTNILLSHNPDSFPRAARLGFDLTLSGHTHGGQASLEFISPEIAPSRLVTPYVAGWFQRGAGQLYVNRGIGTVGVPIRVGAPPEITVFELVNG